MTHRHLRSRLLLAFALFAWLAQVCLPVAHAAVMAEQNAGLATWCGPLSPGMSAKLAQLPTEVREILQKGSAQAEQHQDCMQFCAGAATDALHRVNPTILLRAAGLEPAAPPALENAHRPVWPKPPARGPPQIS